MVFSKITSGLISDCVNEFKKPENQDKIQSGIVDPLLDYVICRLKPYIWMVSLFTTLMILLMIVIVICLMQQRKTVL